MAERSAAWGMFALVYQCSKTQQLASIAQLQVAAQLPVGVSGGLHTPCSGSPVWPLHLCTLPQPNTTALLWRLTHVRRLSLAGTA